MNGSRFTSMTSPLYSYGAVPKPRNSTGSASTATPRAATAAFAAEPLPVRSAAASECCHQDRYNHDRCDERNAAKAVFRRPAAEDQQQVGCDHPLDHRGVAQSAAHGALVEMLAMRLPDALSPQQPAQERDCRVGNEVERQDQSYLPATVIRQ